MNTEQYLKAAREAVQKAKGWITNTNQYWLVVGAIVFAFMVGRWSADASPASTHAQTRSYGRVERIDVTVQQIQNLLSQTKQMTKLQRAESLNSYLNKVVCWQGKLKSASISQGEIWAVISHSIKPAWILGQRQVNVSVNFADSERDQLLNAPKGSVVTYEGILSECTISSKQPWRVTDGTVLSVETPALKTR